MPGSNSKYTREKREQGEGLTSRDYDGSGRLPGVFAFGIE